MRGEGYQDDEADREQPRDSNIGSQNDGPEIAPTILFTGTLPNAAGLVATPEVGSEPKFSHTCVECHYID